MNANPLQQLWWNVNGLVRRLHLGSVGLPCRISPAARFADCTANIHVGASTRIWSQAFLQCDADARLTIGSGCEVHPFARLMTYHGPIRIGDACSINPYSILYGHGGLEIGSQVRIAAHVVIIPANHSFELLDVPIMEQEIRKERIVIEDDVWIGAGARILGGVTVHRGAVVGAGAVVTADVPENCVVAGVPARPIKMRGERGPGAAP